MPLIVSSDGPMSVPRVRRQLREVEQPAPGGCNPLDGYVVSAQGFDQRSKTRGPQDDEPAAESTFERSTTRGPRLGFDRSPHVNRLVPRDPGESDMKPTASHRKAVLRITKRRSRPW